jgi:hypothetical protein
MAPLVQQVAVSPLPLVVAGAGNRSRPAAGRGSRQRPLPAGPVDVSAAETAALGQVVAGQPPEILTNLAQHHLVDGRDPQPGADAHTRRECNHERLTEGAKPGGIEAIRSLMWRGQYEHHTRTHVRNSGGDGHPTDPRPYLTYPPWSRGGTRVTGPACRRRVHRPSGRALRAGATAAGSWTSAVAPAGSPCRWPARRRSGRHDPGASATTVAGAHRRRHRPSPREGWTSRQWASGRLGQAPHEAAQARSAFPAG